MSEAIRSLADLRPGDIMFGPIGGLVPGFFPVGVGQAMLGELFHVGALNVRHVGVVTHCTGDELGPPVVRIVQAMPRGAEEISVTAETHWTPRHAYARPPEDYPGQAENAAAIARLFVSEQVPYSFTSYVALAAWRFGLRVERLAKWIDRRGADGLPREAICSVLADQSWTLAGKDLVKGTRSQIVTPGMLARTLWTMPGVIWGGAGMLESRG